MLCFCRPEDVVLEDSADNRARARAHIEYLRHAKACMYDALNSNKIAGMAMVIVELPDTRDFYEDAEVLEIVKQVTSSGLCLVLLAQCMGLSND